MAIAPVEGNTLQLVLPQRSVAEAPALGESTQLKEGIPFSTVFLEAVASANNQAHFAHQASAAMAAGTNDDIHGTMIELSKAAIEVRLATSIRNKVVDAFFEIWRMSI